MPPSNDTWTLGEKKSDLTGLAEKLETKGDESLEAEKKEILKALEDIQIDISAPDTFNGQAVREALEDIRKRIKPLESSQ